MLEYLNPLNKILIMSLLEDIKARAKANKKRIVLPEGDSERTLKAAHIILQEGIAHVILLGNESIIHTMEKEFGLDLSKAEIINPKTSPKRNAYIEKFAELRKSKGMTLQEAETFMNQEIYWGPMMIFM